MDWIKRGVASTFEKPLLEFTPVTGLTISDFDLLSFDATGESLLSKYPDAYLLTSAGDNMWTIEVVEDIYSDPTISWNGVSLIYKQNLSSLYGGYVGGDILWTVTMSNGMVYSSSTYCYINWYCLARGTYIIVLETDRKTGKKRRRKKKIEELTYDDEVLVWDFDKGEFTTAKILWLMKKQEATQYNVLKFSDGSELKTINQHRIFNKELGRFTYPMTDDTPIGTTTFNSEGKEVKLISKKIVEEYVQYYNVISEYHMNVFANGILTSCRLSNIYPIEDMKYVKDNREIVGIEEFKDIPKEYYYGLRLGEQPVDINRDNSQKFGNTLVEYVMNLIKNSKNK